MQEKVNQEKKSNEFIDSTEGRVETIYQLFIMCRVSKTGDFLQLCKNIGGYINIRYLTSPDINKDVKSS